MKKSLNTTKCFSLTSFGILLAASLIASIVKISPIHALSVPITPPITPPIITPTPTLPITPPITITPRPTFIPTNTPTPSPKPKPNNLPVIQTNSLPNAKKGSNYWARVNAYDLDSKDTLSMTISGLPSGLSKTNCTTFYRNDPATGKQIVWLGCDIGGRTYTLKATYKVQVTVMDNKGGITSKTLYLKIF